MEAAYSLELNKVIDSEKAYELYWEGGIQDLKAFICLVEGCFAQVTLSSAKKEKYLLKKIPHFRCYGDHKLNCPEDMELEVKKKEEVSKAGLSNRPLLNSVDTLVIKRPDKKTTVINSGTASIENTNRIKREYKKGIERDGKRQSEYLTLSPLVSKYLKYKELEKVYDNIIINQGKELYYGSFFVELENKTYTNFSSFYRVYYGEARVYKMGNNEDFRVVFEASIQYNNENFRPNTYVSKKIIENSYKNKKWYEELLYYAQNDEVVNAFIYGKPKLNKSGDKTYFNINIGNAKLDLIDIRKGL